MRSARCDRCSTPPRSRSAAARAKARRKRISGRATRMARSPCRPKHRGELLDTDVLIVGAGPTGLMLANQLARRGLRFEIIDRHSGPAQQSRAMAVHARTLEIYAKLGIAEQAVARGAR